MWICMAWNTLRRRGGPDFEPGALKFKIGPRPHRQTMIGFHRYIECSLPHQYQSLRLMWEVLGTRSNKGPRRVAPAGSFLLRRPKSGFSDPNDEAARQIELADATAAESGEPTCGAD